MRAALIGAGRIAREHLGCLQTLPEAEIVAVCDRSLSVAEAAAERFGVPSWYTDAAAMLAEARPEVVHVTTPAGSHHPLAYMALESGAHVLVEKPATERLDQLVELMDLAESKGLALVENQNYLFNGQTRAILRMIESGELGSVVHVDVSICLEIAAPGGSYNDPNAPHPSLLASGGAITEFLTHLASLSYGFVGPHRSAQSIWSKRSPSLLPSDEFRGLIDAERGTALLSFSGNSQPDGFWLRIFAERGRAEANLFETRLTTDPVRAGSKPLRSVFNGLREAKAVRRSAVGGLWRKLSGGPGSYEGLYDLISRTYRALSKGEEPPIPARQVIEVNRLVDDLKPCPIPEHSS